MGARVSLRYRGYAGEWALTHSDRAAFMRDCQPLPVALNAANVALSTRKAICVRFVPDGRPRRRLTSARMAAVISGASSSCGAVLASNLARAKSERLSPRSRAACISAGVIEVVCEPVMVNLPFRRVRHTKADDAMWGSGRVNHQQDMQYIEHIGERGDSHLFPSRRRHIEAIWALQHQVGVSKVKPARLDVAFPLLFVPCVANFHAINCICVNSVPQGAGTPAAA